MTNQKVLRGYVTGALVELIRRRRAELGLSLRDVAEDSGGAFTPQALNQIELRRRRTVSPPIMAGLARALEVPLDQITDAAEVWRSVDEAARRWEMPRKYDAIPPGVRRHVQALLDDYLRLGS